MLTLPADFFGFVALSFSTCSFTLPWERDTGMEINSKLKLMMLLIALYGKISRQMSQIGRASLKTLSPEHRATAIVHMFPK
jgi:hypothetical protein